mmetsp:Transcript_42869/g.98329  ORF Transcript_42869/g.98329 Transcript_42869/m.98329 type:complete len:339 (-) Transcript_42869:6579-7595(-)
MCPCAEHLGLQLLVPHRRYGRLGDFGFEKALRMCFIYAALLWLSSRSIPCHIFVGLGRLGIGIIADPSHDICVRARLGPSCECKATLVRVAQVLGRHDLHLENAGVHFEVKLLSLSRVQVSTLVDHLPFLLVKGWKSPRGLDSEDTLSLLWSILPWIMTAALFLLEVRQLQLECLWGVAQLVERWQPCLTQEVIRVCVLIPDFEQDALLHVHHLHNLTLLGAFIVKSNDNVKSDALPASWQHSAVIWSQRCTADLANWLCKQRRAQEARQELVLCDSCACQHHLVIKVSIHVQGDFLCGHIAEAIHRQLHKPTLTITSTRESYPDLLGYGWKRITDLQ